MKKLISILIFFFICLSTQATTYYISASGNDGNNGTSTSTPWETLAKITASSFSAGDNILFNRGDVFYGSLTIHNSGSSGNPITLGAYGSGANPVITGFTTVSSFTQISTNIWESSSAVSTLTTCNVVSINGINTPMGRIPNSGFYTYQSFSGSTSISSASVNSAVINWTGAQAVIRKERYVFTKPIITSASGSNLNFLSDGYNGRNGWGFFIQNDIRTLDQQNEWYFNSNTHKIDIYSISAPTNVQVASIADLVTATNVSYITFDGITFTGANAEAFYTGNFANCKIQNCNFDFNYQAFQGKQFGGSSPNLLINNNTFNHTNNDCIDFSSEFTSPTVTNNKISNTATFEGMMASGQSGWGMNITSSNALIQNNIVDTSGYVGIGFNSTSSAPMTIKNNYVNYFCYLKDDGGGIYTGNAQISQLIDSNIVVNGIGNNTGTGATNFLAEGIYCDDNSSGFTITHNTVANCSLGYFLHNANNITLTNNTGYNNGMGLFISNDNGATFTTNIYSHQNKFIAATATGTLGIGDERTIYYATAHTSGCDICNFGSSDSNYYARPIDDNLTIRYTIYAVADNDANLAMWQTYSGLDAHSHKSPATITNVNQLFFAYNPNSYDSTVSIPAGTWIDVTGTSFATSTVLHAYSSIVLIYTGSATPPTANAGVDQSITWPANSVTLSGSGTAGSGSIVAYGWAKISGGTATITNSSSASTTVTGLDVGIYLFSLTITNTSGATANDTMQVTVNKGAASLSFSSPTLTQTWTGLPLAPTVITVPSGLATSILYNGIGATPIEPNTYALNANITDLVHWNSSPITETFVINKATATFTITGTTPYFNNTAQVPFVATNPANLTGVNIASPHTNPGTYSDTITLNNAHYQATQVIVPFIISTAGASIVITGYQNIFYTGSPISVIPVTNPAGLTNTVTYNGSSSPPTLSGTYQVIGTVTQVGFSGADTVTMIIQKASPVLTYPAQTSIVQGTALTAANFNATSNTAGTFTYNYSVGQILAPRTYLLTGTFHPTDSANYNSGTTSTTISIFGSKLLNFYIIQGNTIYLNL